MKKLIAVLLLVCLLPLCALAENISEHKHAELTAEGIRVCFLLPQDVMFLSGKSPVKDWAGLPEAYVRQRRSDISVGWLNGLIAQKGKAQWDIQWVLLKGEGGDLDELPPEAAQQFYEDTVLYYREEGCDVSGGGACWMGEHRYINASYVYPNQRQLLYIEEYYTRQNGWNVTVQLTGYDRPAPEEAYALLRGIVESQVITVTE